MLGWVTCQLVTADDQWSRPVSTMCRRTCSAGEGPPVVSGSATAGLGPRGEHTRPRGADTGPVVFDDLPLGSAPAASGKTLRFTGMTVLKVQNGLIVEELGLDDGVTVLQQLGIIPNS